MWYFTWILGLGLNAMWFELDADQLARARPADTTNIS
jgi:cyd operon protein YbgT